MSIQNRGKSASFVAPNNFTRKTLLFLFLFPHQQLHHPPLPSPPPWGKSGFAFSNNQFPRGENFFPSGRGGGMSFYLPSHSDHNRYEQRFLFIWKSAKGFSDCVVFFTFICPVSIQFIVKGTVSRD